jgi:hypothetical protein
METALLPDDLNRNNSEYHHLLEIGNNQEYLLFAFAMLQEPALEPASFSSEMCNAPKLVLLKGRNQKYKGACIDRCSYQVS